MTCAPRRTLLAIMACAPLLTLAGCASPPLRLYTLGVPSDANVSEPHLSSRAATIAISRVILPDYLDSQDIITRQGEEILRSARARWATRLSIGVTDLLTNVLSNKRPSELITDQPLADVATMRIQVDISRFDVDTNGVGTLDATWAVLPRDPNLPLTRERVHLVATGNVGSAADVAALMRGLVIRLAERVNTTIPAGQ
ncbi:membrane integrity-associated transporter subunit PqiC [Acetobacter okinawensis]|uniref:Membrane protein n=1 Tax=Acetobacter okinawensis TaxID=1076594 RepID=A0A252BTI3_9PROT|nr:PqiC family protein [Acetobacter okinawensis]OUJ12177.1 membrane protein [Acetobacter okinawensis]